MWETYRSIIPKYPRISLQEERRLIRRAKKGSSEAADELVLRHIGFVIFRIHKRAFPAYIKRFGEDLASQAMPVLYAKIQTYNLRYRDRDGRFKPVRFSSYVWKRIDGLILDSLKRERRQEKFFRGPDWERFLRRGRFWRGHFRTEPVPLRTVPNLLQNRPQFK